MGLTPILVTLAIYFGIGFFLDVYLIRSVGLSTAADKKTLLLVFVLWITIMPFFVIFCIGEGIIKLLSIFEDK